MRKRRKSPSFQVNPLYIWTVIFFAFTVIIIVCMEIRIKPIAENICMRQAKSITQETVDHTVRTVVESNNAEFVKLTKNDNGTVSAIEADTSNINFLKTTVSESISEALEENSETIVSVPVGSVSNINLFAGRGVKVKMKIVPSRSVSTSVRSEIVSTGINQTCHRILLDVNTEISVIMPVSTQTVTVTETYVIAETVIIGEIPDNLITK